MNEFLNPKSMLTPGAAGSLMMLLANTLCAVFPELAFRYVAISLSFVIGLAILVSANMKLAERATYWVINSLVIFAVGVGTSNIAANAAAGPGGAPKAELRQSLATAATLLVPAATADTTSDAKLLEEIEQLRRENERLRAQTEKRTATDEVPAAAKSPRPQPLPAPVGQSDRNEGFFKRW
jgi:hypothetical protein